MHQRNFLRKFVVAQVHTMPTKRYIAIFLISLVLLLVCTPMVSKMSCLSSGKVVTAIGQLDGCCGAHTVSPEPTFRANCCEFAQVAIDADLFQTSEFSLANIIAPVLELLKPVFAHGVNSVAERTTSLRAPPLRPVDFLAEVCVFRL